jgi:hypothetical protein
MDTLPRRRAMTEAERTMKGNRAVLTAVVVVVVLILGWWLFGRSARGGRVDLIDQFAGAEKRPNAEQFSVADVTLGGTTKKAIAVTPAVGTRLIWKARIPDDGWLWVSIGMKPEAWQQEGNGVKFMILVSDSRASEVVFEQHLNPFANEGDRKWVDGRVDLSTYAGEEVSLIFNTLASPAGQPTDIRNDLALWGSPEVVVR